MNHEFLALATKEKIRQLTAEGLESQAYNRGRPPSRAYPKTLPRLVLAGMSLLAVALLWVF
jgi:hypothetical protein